MCWEEKMITPEKFQVSDHQGINLGQADNSRALQAAKGTLYCSRKKHMEQEHEQA